MWSGMKVSDFLAQTFPSVLSLRSRVCRPRGKTSQEKIRATCLPPNPHSHLFPGTLVTGTPSTRVAGS